MSSTFRLRRRAKLLASALALALLYRAIYPSHLTGGTTARTHRTTRVPLLVRKMQSCDICLFFGLLHSKLYHINAEKSLAYSCFVRLGVWIPFCVYACVCVCLLFLSTITATVSRGCWTQGAQTLQRAILVGESRTKPTSSTSALSAEGMKRTEPKKKPNFQHSPDKLIAISWLP